MRRIWMLFLTVLLLSGCRSISDFKPDTIVDIPLHPTEEQTMAATEAATIPTELPTETEPATEATEPTESATQPPKTNSGSEPTGGKKPSQGSTGKKPTATEPPPTQPPTEPPTQAPTAPPAYDPSGYAPSSLDRAVADRINGQRQAEGLAALRLDSRLCAIASVRARETSQTWNSTRPDGRSGITVLAEYGYGYAAAAENLYFGSANASAAVDKWMSSDSRRANLLMEEADTIGVGSYTAADGVTFIAVLIVG